MRKSLKINPYMLANNCSNIPDCLVGIKLCEDAIKRTVTLKGSSKMHKVRLEKLLTKLDLFANNPKSGESSIGYMQGRGASF